jgi:pilus assembly protein Flp/PilA
MSRITSTFRRFVADESGAGMVEYALLVALIGVLLIGVLTTLRGGIANTFGEATTALNGGSSP